MDKEELPPLMAYLDGTLSPSERNLLEQELSVNPALQAELNSLQATIAAVKQYGLQQRVAAIHASLKDQGELSAPVRSIPRRNRTVLVRVAATVLLFIAAYFVYSLTRVSAEKVFAANYHPFELATLRDGTTNETPATKAYREKDIKTLEQLAAGSSDPQTIFLAGAASLDDGQPATAIRFFERSLAALPAGTSLLRQQNDYYLALAYLRNKDFSKALALMKQIRNDPSHIYREQITDKLLRQVRRLNH